MGPCPPDLIELVCILAKQQHWLAPLSLSAWAIWPKQLFCRKNTVYNARLYVLTVASNTLGSVRVLSDSSSASWFAIGSCMPSSAFKGYTKRNTKHVKRYVLGTTRKKMLKRNRQIYDFLSQNSTPWCTLPVFETLIFFYTYLKEIYVRCV